MSDDILAATAILCEYESLDASTAAWIRHLSGTKTLLDVVEMNLVRAGSGSDTPPGSSHPLGAAHGSYDIDVTQKSLSER
ncbi:MAG: hypothetical protein Q9186_006318 [Xanthomendoza sp. 1 TL-2023]